MTALERAKRFVQKHAAETALVIVPLAMAAPAHASSVTFNAGTATVTSSGLIPLSPTTGFDALPNGGIQFFGNYPFELVPDSNSGGGFGQFSLTLTLGGSASGLLDMNFIPVSWDYAFNGESMLTLESNIIFAIKTTTPNTYDAGSGPVGPNPPLPNQSFSGNLALTDWDPLVPESLSSWSVILTASGTYNTASPRGSMALSIPNHSIDISPLADVPGGDGAVPEPATLLLLGPGVALLIRRRRARSQRH